MSDDRRIDVGDTIVIKNSLGGVSRYRVHRVTKCYAFVQLNERAERKFRREVNGFGQVVPVNRYTWDSTRRTLEKAKP